MALGILAQAKYHVFPGEYFTDEHGRTWRFANRSGSKDSLNVDVFRGALGGIVRKPSRATIGEAGPKAVLPLSRNTASLGTTNIYITVQSNADPTAALPLDHSFALSSIFAFDQLVQTRLLHPSQRSSHQTG